MSEDGGSFWATFGGGGSDGAPQVSALEKLLQTPNCSVEALLDEEEVIQEFKTGNKSLVARLSEPDGIKVLMECITCEPPPEAPHARCYRYPFVAVELMTCAPPKFMELLVNPENQAMELLWSFLSTKPDEVNPVLAGYFSRTATALMSKHQKEVLDYLRQRGPDQLMEEFLSRIHFRSLAELFARLLSGEAETQVIFQTADVVQRLLKRWQEDSNSDAQENITLVLAELLNQKDSLYWIEDLTQQLTAPDTVQFLIDHIFTRPSGVPPAMSLLTTVILHTGKDGQAACASSTPTLSPLASPALLAEDGAANLDEAAEAEAARALPAASTPQNTLGSASSEWMERSRAALMREVAGHFPRFRELLDSFAEASLEATLSMPQGSIKAVGGTVLEVISLIATVSRSGLEVILEALFNNQLLPRCVDVLFRHPWSSLLHNAVQELLTKVLSGTDRWCKQLSLQILKEARLAEHIVEEFTADAAWNASKQKHARVGYMGHLVSVGAALQESKSDEVSELLSSTDGWSDVVTRIEAVQKLHKEQLGGGVPASDRGLASSSLPTTTEESEKSENSVHFAACPAWSQRVLGKKFLNDEPTALQEVDSSADAQGPAEAAVQPNGQGSSPSSSETPAAAEEDAFDPDGARGVADAPPSPGSWASFTEETNSGFPEPTGNFASFATEWPADAFSAPSSPGWASFEEPPEAQVPVAAKQERQPEPDMFPQGGGGTGAASGSTAKEVFNAFEPAERAGTWAAFDEPKERQVPDAAAPKQERQPEPDMFPQGGGGTGAASGSTAKEVFNAFEPAERAGTWAAFDEPKERQAPAPVAAPKPDRQPEPDMFAQGGGGIGTASGSTAKEVFNAFEPAERAGTWAAFDEPKERQAPAPVATPKPDRQPEPDMFAQGGGGTSTSSGSTAKEVFNAFEPAERAGTWAAFDEPKDRQAPAPVAAAPKQDRRPEPHIFAQGRGGTKATSGSTANQVFNAFEPTKAAKEAPPVRTAKLSEELGAENLFALIGEGFSPSRSSPPKAPSVSTVPKQQSVVSSPWPSIPPATPWSADWAAPAVPKAKGPGVAAGYGAASVRDGSLISDFDPFAESKVTPKNAPSAASNEFPLLDLPWPSKSATSQVTK